MNCLLKSANDFYVIIIYMTAKIFVGAISALVVSAIPQMVEPTLFLQANDMPNQMDAQVNQAYSSFGSVACQFIYKN
jgi:hypothetical protein